MTRRGSGPSRPSLPVSFLQNVRLRSVTVFGRSLISPDDRVMYEGVRVFRGRFFARGLGPSPTTDLDPNLVTSHINPSKSNPHPLTSKVGTPEVQRRKREVAEGLDVPCEEIGVHE